MKVTVVNNYNFNENTSVSEKRVNKVNDYSRYLSNKFPCLTPGKNVSVYVTGGLLRKAMNDLGVTGMTVTQVMGCGIQKGAGEKYRGVEVDATLLPKVKVEVVVSKIPVEAVIEAAKKALYTGHIGDGKIFVYPVEKVVKIRTGEEDYDALQDVE